MKIKKLRYNRKKVFIGLFLFLVLLGLSLGYAFVRTTLSIDGVTTVKDARWDVHFANYQAMTGSVELENDPTITGTNVSFAAKLEGPGTFYGFTIDVINSGTINAEIGNIAITPDLSTYDYLDYTVSYADDVNMNIGDVLAANGGTKTIKVLMSYIDGIDESLYPTTDQTFNISITLNYQQHTGALPNFATDSWDTISGNPANYSVGDTKTIEIYLNNVNRTYTLRVANTSTPAECSTTGFSQSACGFVVEFAQILDENEGHTMNPYDLNASYTSADLGYGNVGGWEYSNMRAYLNSGVYAAGHIDYSPTNSLVYSGLYNKLPSDMRSAMVYTRVVSGHGYLDSANFTTLDKLYLLSAHEIWEDDDDWNGYLVMNGDTAYNNTRQLDYYKSEGVTTTNNLSAAMKQNTRGINKSWILRTACFDSSGVDDGTFFYVDAYTGDWNFDNSDTLLGVAPAFRLAG